MSGKDHVTILRPRRGLAGLGIQEIWEYRGLLWVLAKRNIKVRYKQTIIGAGWAIVQPLATMVIFTIFFGNLAQLDQKTGDTPYALFALSGLVLWYYFSQGFGSAVGSLVEHRSVVTKVYFPRIILPLAPLISGLVDLGVSTLALLGMIVYFKVPLTPHIIYFPFFVLFTLLTGLALALWLSALNARYRDFRYVIPFLLQIGFFLSPIAYPTKIVPAQYQSIYGLNPLVGIIDGFRWSLIGQDTPPGPMLWQSLLIVLVLLISGFSFFHRMERNFVDVI